MTPPRLLLPLFPVAALTLADLASGQALSYNTGSLGAVADATHTAGVLLDEPGFLPDADDFSCTYSVGNRSTLEFQPAVNPAVSSPFTIEFWARPTVSDNDDVPVNNRVGSGNRSGWVFFQRGAATGWNFRMYNGNGGNLGWDLTGGTSTLSAWSHVVVTWDGTAARLYVNGADTNATNLGNGVYNPSTTAAFSIGALADGNSPMTGSVDEVAFYPTALSAARILEHYQTGTGGAPGSYAAMVAADAPLLYFQQNPPFARVTRQGNNAVITFTGILSESTDLTEGSWQDLPVTSPYTVVPTPENPRRFFRTRR
jgi:hypothetical protein